MAAECFGMMHWEANRGEDGHLDIVSEWLVETTDPLDGPVVVGSCSGLPATFSIWSYGNDVFSEALCSPLLVIVPNKPKDGSKGVSWTVQVKHTTRPVRSDALPGNPLTAPAKFSGSFLRFQAEAPRDRHGNLLVTTSFEPIQADARMRDYHRSSVQVEFNTASYLNAANSAIHHLNDATLWGCPARTVKLSEFSWRVAYHGNSAYYENTLGFEIQLWGWEKEAYNGGMKSLPKALDPDEVAPGWTVPNYRRPELYVANRDLFLNNTYTLLTDRGRPVSTPAEIVIIDVSHYDSYNMSLLGFPTSLPT